MTRCIAFARTSHYIVINFISKPRTKSKQHRTKDGRQSFCFPLFSSSPQTIIHRPHIQESWRSVDNTRVLKPHPISLLRFCFSTLMDGSSWVGFTEVVLTIARCFVLNFIRLIRAKQKDAEILQPELWNKDSTNGLSNSLKSLYPCTLSQEWKHC